MKIEIDVDIPPGFEATGEYRIPDVGEWYLATSYGPVLSYGQHIANQLILRKVGVPPTMEHAGKDVLVRQLNDKEWRTRQLLYINEDGYWCYYTSRDSKCAVLWKHARVID